MSTPVDFQSVARLAAAADNVAIAIRRIEAGTAVEIDGIPRRLSHTILEGHRFAVRPIEPGEPMLSWGMPFGVAVAAIAPGDAISNPSMIEALALRRLGVPLPTVPNFADNLVPFQLVESEIRPAPPVETVQEPRTFLGYRRPGRRGIGTRNSIVILGTSSRTASFARQLAARLAPLARINPSLDGIVAVAHTEGGGTGEPNNAAEVLRALAGFMVNPNVGAVLALDHGNEPINNERLRVFMEAKGYPLGEVPHAFLSVRSGLAAGLAEGERIVRSWLPRVAAARRTPEPLSGLRIALQCGGSDAFSGVSGNPLAGAMVHEVIRHGGTGVLCETDELSGAEPYVMKNVRDLATAKRLVGFMDSFRQRLNWHGITPESNPSAGNKLRGLYNIALKSLGAVHKKDPRTRIDQVIDYAEPLTEPGFYFMNSPGNDLEGIAGQAAAGCNVFLFATGNGSITNFPFVPTLKITTTSRRHELLSHEMDINAGRYLDGEPMEKLSAEAVDLLIATASGQRTKGELAGHSQTSLWRNWQQSDTSRLAQIRAKPVPDGKPLRAVGASASDPARTERIGLILPTSMCAAQIARMAANRLNEAPHPGIDRFVALAHSEGCGFGGESMYRLLLRSYRGYATHPNVVSALLLEHGCEKIPNDAMRRQFEQVGLPLDRFGWSSVQLDGGIDKTLARIAEWFAPASGQGFARREGPVSVGLLSATSPSDEAATLLARLANELVEAGGSVVIPESDPLLAHPTFRRIILPGIDPSPTLSYGEPIMLPGLHVADTETDHWVENLTGMGANGVHLFVGLVADAPQQGHPLVPLIQVAERSHAGDIARQDVDLVLTGETEPDFEALMALLANVAAGTASPAAQAGGFVDFQLSRGLLGVST